MSERVDSAISRRAVFAASGGALAASAASSRAQAGDSHQVAAAPPADESLQMRPAGTGAVSRPMAAIINDWSNSVISYGAVGDDVRDDTAAFQRALAAHPGKQIFVPPRTYRLGAVGGLDAAGAGVVGVAGYDTVLKPVGGFAGSIFFNPRAGEGGSAYGLLRDLRFDLDGVDCVAIDLSHCDTWVVERVNGRGGLDRSRPTGALVKFGAPARRSSYNNVLRDCGAECFSRAVVFGPDANQNRIDGGSFTNNHVAFDCAPEGTLRRPQLLGVRVEGNTIGVREGAQGGVYLGYFENNSVGDFSFTTASEQAVILPGSTTASTPAPLHNLANARGLRCLSYGFGYHDSAESESTPAFERRRQIRSAPGVPLEVAYPDVEFTDLHMSSLLMANGRPLEGVNAAGRGTVVIAQVNQADEVEISGFDRDQRRYSPVNIGGGSSVRPTTTGQTDLGSDTRRWKSLHLAGEVSVDGHRVIAARGAAVADAHDPASAVIQLNLLLSRLRRHGLIAS